MTCTVKNTSELLRERYANAMLTLWHARCHVLSGRGRESSRFQFADDADRDAWAILHKLQSDVCSEWGRLIALPPPAVAPDIDGEISV